MIQIIGKIEIEKSHNMHHLLFLQPVTSIPDPDTTCMWHACQAIAQGYRLALNTHGLGSSL